MKTYLRLLIRMAFLFDVEFDYYLNINNSYTMAFWNGEYYEIATLV
jgi:hypothetical protein